MIGEEIYGELKVRESIVEEHLFLKQNTSQRVKYQTNIENVETVFRHLTSGTA